MPLLVFWLLLAPRRWRCFLALRSAVVVCELNDMRDIQQKNKTNKTKQNACGAGEIIEQTNKTKRSYV